MTRNVFSSTAKRASYGVAAVLALALTWSCGTEEPDVTPASVTATAGNGQTAEAGSAVATAPAVTVTNADGALLSGVSITFVVTAGGGSVTGADATTSAEGVATVGSWTLGDGPGNNALIAGISEGLTATFTATGTAPPMEEPDTTPASVTATAGNGQTAEVGSAVATAPAVTVTNADGMLLSDVSVTFVVTAGGGSVTGADATTNAEGVATVGSWTLGTEPGTNALVGVVGAGLGASFTATGASPPAGSPAFMTIIEGDDQTGLLSTDLPVSPGVRIEDEDGIPVQGVEVTFAPQGGSGSVGSSTATTDVNGEASTTWAPGQWGTNLMDATAGSLTQTFFSIGSNSDFKLEIVFLNTTTITQKSAFGAAAGRWMDVITGDLTDVVVRQNADYCGVGEPAIFGVTDDLLIYASLVPIDGPLGILGSAGPCVVRGNVSDAPLTVTGVMQFDVADLGILERSGTLDETILHEMGHVLGIGTLWSFVPLDFLQNPSYPFDEGADTHFDGPNAIAAFNALPGGPWNPPTSANSVVPVENVQGGGGTQDGHWRESTFVTELMTGFIGSTSNPLSTVTIQSLLDIGYAVDITKADPYILGDPNGAPPADPSATRFHLKDDILRIPITMVDRNGRIVRVVDP